MFDTINNMALVDQFFLLIALLGTIIFIIRTALMFSGFADIEGEGIDNLDVDTADSVDSADDSSDDGFSFLSLQSITSFLMIFGWSGFMVSYEMQLPLIVALLAGFVSGSITVLILKKIFLAFMKLKSSGNVRAHTATGKGASVYLRIPAEGSGQIEVEVDGRLKIYDAVSADKKEISTGEKVTVVWVQEDDTMVVERDQTTEGGKLLC